MQRVLALTLALMVFGLCPCLEAKVSVPTSPRARPQQTLRAKFSRGWSKTKAFVKRHERKIVVGAATLTAVVAATTLAIADSQGLGVQVPPTDVGFILDSARHLADPAVVKAALTKAPTDLKVAMGMSVAIGALSGNLAYGIVKNKREVGHSGFRSSNPILRAGDVLTEMNSPRK